MLKQKRCPSFAFTHFICLTLAWFLGASLQIVFCLHILYCLKLARFFGASLHIVFTWTYFTAWNWLDFWVHRCKSFFVCTYYIAWNWLDFLVHRCTSFFFHILHCLKLARFFGASRHIVKSSQFQAVKYVQEKTMRCDAPTNLASFQQ